MSHDPREGGVPCPDVEEISARLDGALDPVRAGEIDAHLATCAACARLRFRLEQAASLVQGLPRETASEELVRRVAGTAARPRRALFGPAAWAWAAAASGLIGVVLLFRLVDAQRAIDHAPAPMLEAHAKKSAAEPSVVPAEAPAGGVDALEAARADLDAQHAVADDKANAGSRLAKDDADAAGGKRAELAASIEESGPREADKEEQLRAGEPAAPPAAQFRRDVGSGTGSFSPSPETSPDTSAAAAAPPAPAAPATFAQNERAKTAPADGPAREREAKPSTAPASKLAVGAEGGALGAVAAASVDDNIADERRQAPVDRCEILMALVSGGAVVMADSPGVTPPRLMTPGRLEVPGAWLAAPASVSVLVLVEADGSARACRATAAGVLAAPRAEVERRAGDLVASWRYEPARRGEGTVACEVVEQVPVVAAP
jgi:hypothetical protein